MKNETNNTRGLDRGLALDTIGRLVAAGLNLAATLLRILLH